MSKISLLTELTDGNIVDNDLFVVVDTSASITKKGQASSLYTYHLDKLAAANRLVPTLTSAGTTFLRDDGTFATPPDTNTTYAVMAAGNSYAAGLVAAGAATHTGSFLRKDGTWAQPHTSQYWLTTARPTVTISTDGATDGTFVLAATTFVDTLILNSPVSDNITQTQLSFSSSLEIELAGHSSGSMTFQLSIDFASFSVTMTNSVISPTIFPVTLFNITDRTHYPATGTLTGTSLKTTFNNAGFTADATKEITISGFLQYLTVTP